jgi:hypothetical protein
MRLSITTTSPFHMGPNFLHPGGYERIRGEIIVVETND